MNSTYQYILLKYLINPHYHSTRIPDNSEKQDNDPLTLSDHMKKVMAKSHSVIVCMSREYKSKQNCHKVKTRIMIMHNFPP